MEDYVFRVLELNKVLEMLADHCISDMGKAQALALRPSVQFDQVSALQEQTAQAESIYTAMGHSPLLSFDDCRAALQKSRIGGMLTMAELLQVRTLLTAARRLYQTIDQQDEQNECRLLHFMADQLVYDDALEKHIGQCIVSAEEMSDFASPQLSDLRRKIRRENAKIREKLDGYIHSSANQKYLQDTIVTLRNGRYVLPVKQEFRTMVPGLVHDQSGSGQTLFIEPMALVEANNTIRMLQGEERMEIERILYELSAQVAPLAQGLDADMDILSTMDVIFAKAALSKQMKAVRPKLDSEQIAIVQGRHPLIDPQKVVPVDIAMQPGCRGLLITGPNTGGKTVTLKMVGLFAMMAQCGLHIPAQVGASLPIFDGIFADVGDEQSIEQSLSTFSSHMTNIIRIVERVSEKSLVLLDELGAGTDPGEGSALAMAVLDRLLERGSHLLVTTHYGELKAYALEHEQLDNASMEFDSKTLQPTYRIIAGVAGRSNAFEITQRLGMDPKIVEKAKSYLSKERIVFDQMLGEAQQQLEQARAERELATKQRYEAEYALNATKARVRELEEKGEQALAKAKEKAQSIVQQTRVQAEESIREIKRSASLEQNQRQQAFTKARKGLNDAWDALRDKGEQTNPARPVNAGNLRVGDAVLVGPMDTPAVVIAPPNERGEVQVQAGAMKLSVKMDRIKRSNKKLQPKPDPSAKGFMRTATISMEIDLRGNTVEEAIQTLDGYLDSAAVAGLKTVHVIHGKGTGALRVGVQNFLRHHPHVKSYRLGNYGEGDSGVTVVEIR